MFFKRILAALLVILLGASPALAGTCPANVTWSSTDKNSNITFANANANMNLVYSGSGVCGLIRATKNMTQGQKYYWSGITTVSGGNAPVLGFANASVSTSSCLGDDVGAASVSWKPNGTVRQGNATLASIASYTTFDALDIAVDTGARLVWFRKNSGLWNNSGTADPATGAGGIAYTAISGVLFPAASFLNATENFQYSFSGDRLRPAGFISPNKDQFELGVKDRNGNVTLFSDSLAPWAGVQANAGGTTGSPAAASGARAALLFPPLPSKWYVEFWTSVTGGNQPSFGIANTNAGVNTYVGGDANGIGISPSGAVNFNNATVATYTSFSANQFVGMAVDFTAKLIWFRVNGGNWNNSGTANPVTGVGGLTFSSLAAGPYAVMVSVNSTSNAFVNFGRSPYSFTPPLGFASLDKCPLQGPMFKGPLSANDNDPLKAAA